MKSTLLLFGALIVAFLVGCQKKKYPPQLSSVSPNSAPIGTDVTLSGSQFGDSPTVTIGTTNVSAKTKTDNSITFTVPRMTTGSTTIRVQNQDGTSDPKPFTVLQPLPQLASVDPGNGLPGTTVKITGDFLDQLKTVRFGTAQADVVGSGSSTQVTVKVPQVNRGATKLTVETEGGQNQTDFIVAATPEISSLSSATVVVGSDLLIKGRNLLDGVVSLNGAIVDKTQTQVEDTQIKVKVPETSVGTGKVTVTVFGKLVASSQQALTVAFPPPSISSISPDKGCTGTEVTITGQNFQTIQEVKFGTQTVAVKSNTGSEIKVNAPEFSSVQNVAVLIRANGGTSNEARFTGAPQAEIDQTPVPNGLISGGPLTIRGKNFSSVNSVHFLNGNGEVTSSVAAQSFLPSDAGSIILQVPIGVSAEMIRVNNEYGYGKPRSIGSLNGNAPLTTGNVATSVSTLTNTIITDDCRPTAFFYCASGISATFGFSRKSESASCNEYRKYLSYETLGGKLYEVLRGYTNKGEFSIQLKLQRNNQDTEYTGPAIFLLTNSSGNATYYVGSLTKNMDIYAYSLSDGSSLKMCRQSGVGNPSDYWTISCNCQ